MPGICYAMNGALIPTKDEIARLTSPLAEFSKDDAASDIEETHRAVPSVRDTADVIEVSDTVRANAHLAHVVLRWPTYTGLGLGCRGCQAPRGARCASAVRQ